MLDRHGYYIDRNSGVSYINICFTRILMNIYSKLIILGIFFDTMHKIQKIGNKSGLCAIKTHLIQNIQQQQKFIFEYYGLNVFLEPKT